MGQQSTFELNAAIQDRLEKTGLARESLKVFGALRLNVHVKCVGRETADKWASLLAAMGGKVSVIKTTWDAVENKGTVMLPTVRKGYLVALQGAAA